MNVDMFPADAQDRIQRLEPADLVLALSGCGTLEGLRAGTDAVRRGTTHRTILVHPDTIETVEVLPAGENSGDIQLVPCRMPAVEPQPFATEEARTLLRQLSVIGGLAGARGYGLVGAPPEGITPATIHALADPVINLQIDLALPSYSRHRFDGLINRGVVYPLVRALYGKRADGQLGVDFGLSARMLSALIGQDDRPGPRPSIWLLTEAIERNFQVCQAHVGTFLPPVETSSELSTSLARVLGSLFDDMEQHASLWQRVRGSQPLQTFGDAVAPPDEPRPVDVRTMVESFRLGVLNLPDIWMRVLPPASLIELGRLARVPLDQFRLPDALWARIVFDFALGHRLRVINRDHLLRAMTPLYLAWVASFMLEVCDASRGGVRDRLERLCLAFEAEKPYVIARWRWPDRFNP
ncbi:MAG: hypothetical protein ABI744_07470 [Chloroflexota bacterium]